MLLTSFPTWTGILRLELGKEPYERSGLQGRPIRSGGRKHAKERFGLDAQSLLLNAC